MGARVIIRSHEECLKHLMQLVAITKKRFHRETLLTPEKKCEENFQAIPILLWNCIGLPERFLLRVVVS